MFEVWCDSLVEADWFVDLDSRLNNSKIMTIGSRGKNSKIVDELIQYDRPDIILVENDKAILVLEKTREVPTGHNVGQRVARLVRAAEFGVPVFCFLPFDAMKHGKYAGMCSINTRLLRAMLKLGEIHQTHAIAINWPCNENGELIVDGSENEEIAQVVSAVLDGLENISNGQLDISRENMRSQIIKREDAFPKYRDLPPSAKKNFTSKFLASVPGISQEERDWLCRRNISLVYKMDMTPEKCKRQDPYTGMQFIYDYVWLRNGPHPSNRVENLILHVPLVDKKTWLKNNPNDKETKSCNWYLTADAIVLKNGCIVIKEWEHHIDS